MAEVLAGCGGDGDGLARARAEVDTAATMAWILVAVALPPRGRVSAARPYPPPRRGLAPSMASTPPSPTDDARPPDPRFGPRLRRPSRPRRRRPRHRARRDRLRHRAVRCRQIDPAGARRRLDDADGRYDRRHQPGPASASRIRLLPWRTARFNVAFALKAMPLPRAARNTAATAMLERPGLDAADQTKYPRALSGGMRRRVAPARALVIAPMMFLDEAFSALDVGRARQLQLLVRTEIAARALPALTSRMTSPRPSGLADRVPCSPASPAASSRSTSSRSRRPRATTRPSPPRSPG